MFSTYYTRKNKFSFTLHKKKFKRTIILSISRYILYYYCPLNRKAVSPTSWKPEVGFAFYIGQAPLSQNRAFEEEI